MPRRASTAAGRISAEDTRTAEEVTPAVTAAASITAEAARPRLPVPTTHRLKPRNGDFTKVIQPAIMLRFEK